MVESKMNKAANQSTMPDGAELLSIGKKVIEWANDDEMVEVVLGSSRGTEVSVFDGEIESLTVDLSSGVGIRVIKDQRVGSAYAGSLDPDVIADCFAQARENSRYGSRDEFAGMAEPDGVAPAQISLWRDSLLNVSTDSKVELVLELEKILKSVDPRVTQIPTTRYGDSIGNSAVVSTNGIACDYRATITSLMADAIASDGTDAFEGYGFSVARDFDGLDRDKVVADAIDRATRMIGATKPTSKVATVVFDNRVTASIISIIGSMLNGEEVLKGRSLYAGKIGAKIAPDFVHLVEDPTDEKMFGATSFDSEGLATRRTMLVDGGILSSYLYDTNSARRVGATSTGSAVRGGMAGKTHPGARALYLSPGTSSQAELVEKVEDGVLILTISGLHSGVNQISGEFSVGAEGITIKNGKLGGPIREFTISSTLQDMLCAVREVGNDVEYLPSAAASVSCIVDQVTISGS